MIMLVIQTFLLMAAFLAAGIGVGVVARQTADRRIARLAAAGHPAPEEPSEAAEWSPESAGPLPDDAIIDPDRAAAADQVGVRPIALAGPRDGRVENLKVIRGIGPQNESRLNAIGIYHLDQIATLSADESRWVATYLGFPGRIDREDWIGQAAALAADALYTEAPTGRSSG